MKWVESKQQNSTSLPKAAFPAGRPPWAFPPEVSADRSRWALRRSQPAPLPGAARCCVPYGWVAPKPPWGAAPRCPPGPGRGRGAVLCTLRVVQALTRPRGAAPRGPRLPGGGPHFSREMGRKRAGAPPLDPGVYGPLAVARSFWGLLSLIQQRGYSLRYAKTDLERIFREKYAQEAFSERKPPNQGTHIGPEIAPPPEQCATTAKTSEWKRAGHKRRGSRGQGPRRSFLRLSPEKAGLPPGVGRETTVQVLTCAGPEAPPCRHRQKNPPPTP